MEKKEEKKVTPEIVEKIAISEELFLKVVALLDNAVPQNTMVKANIILRLQQETIKVNVTEQK